MTPRDHYLRTGLYLIAAAIALTILAALLTGCTDSPGNQGQTWTCFQSSAGTDCAWLPTWLAELFPCANCR